MPTNKARINLALPDDLQDLVMKDAEACRLPAATRVTQIIDEHYRRVAEETQHNSRVLKGSALLTARQETTMDFSGGAYAKPALSEEPSVGEAGV